MLKKSNYKLKATFLFVLITPIFFAINTYSQSRSTLSLVYGVAGNSVGGIGIGGPGYQNNGETLYGLNYNLKLTNVFSIETGLEYSVDHLTWDYEDVYDPTFTPQKVTIQLISIPVYAKFSFLKYLFADVGFSADFQTSNKYNNIVDNQAGIGFGAGIGGKYDFKKITVFLNPFFKIHNLNSNGKAGMLSDQGVKIGVGYNF